MKSSFFREEKGKRQRGPREMCSLKIDGLFLNEKFGAQLFFRKTRCRISHASIVTVFQGVFYNFHCPRLLFSPFFVLPVFYSFTYFCLSIFLIQQPPFANGAQKAVYICSFRVFPQPSDRYISKKLFTYTQKFSECVPFSFPSRLARAPQVYAKTWLNY